MHLSLSLYISWNVHGMFYSSNQPNERAQGHEEQQLCVKWSGKEFMVPYNSTSTVLDMKHFLKEHTQVNPERQKFLVRAAIEFDRSYTCQRTGFV